MSESSTGGVEAVKIIAGCVVAAVAYGIAHDLVTTRICVEYFSLGHPAIIASADPVALALIWGVLGTWYVGVLLGIPLVCAARLGPASPWSWRRLIRPLLALLLTMAIGALLAGALGGLVARRTGWSPVEAPELLAVSRRPRFAAVWCAHAVAYGVGFLGGLALPVGVWLRRHAGAGSPPRLP